MGTGSRIVVGLGELLWDCFPDARRPGGAPANVAFHATQLGLEGRVVSRLGADEDGCALRAELEGLGLDLTFVQEDPKRPTGRVTVDASDPTHPVFTIHEDAAWDHLAADTAMDRLAQAAGAVCFGTLAQRHETTRETIHAFLARADTAIRVYDVNLRQSFYDAAWIERSLQAADVVKLNAEEAEVVGTLLGLDASTPRELASGFAGRFGVALTCVTRGARGCILVEEERIVEVPGEVVEVTVGAFFVLGGRA